VPVARLQKSCDNIGRKNGTWSSPEIASIPFSKRHALSSDLSVGKGRFQRNGVVRFDSSAGKERENEVQTKEETQFERIFTQLRLFNDTAFPYYKESKAGRWLFLGMIGMTLLNSGVSVAFSYIGKDFWNALSSKDPTQFYDMLWKYAAALLVGSPVSVLFR